MQQSEYDKTALKSKRFIFVVFDFGLHLSDPVFKMADRHLLGQSLLGAQNIIKEIPERRNQHFIVNHGVKTLWYHKVFVGKIRSAQGKENGVDFDKQIIADMKASFIENKYFIFLYLLKNDL